jgi:hypothetical protein
MMFQKKMLGVTFWFLLPLGLLLAACADVSEAPPAAVATPSPAATPAAGAPPVEPANGSIDDWLRQINAGQIESYHEAPADGAGQSLRWALGYLTYYGTMETIGLDNLIYNALRAQRKLDTGETTAANQPPNDANLLRLTAGIEMDANQALEAQVAQTPAIRRAISQRIVTDQRALSPEQALAADEVIGVIAIPSPEDLGAKYLVYTQETPDADFVFLGGVIVADAVTRAGPARETYSFQGWQQLPWLGDAAGPFWQQIPTGLSGDPANTNEGRPGVLLVHERHYEAVK